MQLPLQQTVLARKDQILPIRRHRRSFRLGEIVFGGAPVRAKSDGWFPAPDQFWRIRVDEPWWSMT